ncbi:hypothetical protein ENSA5_16290 [Enhygromyxa salina]|uniref:Uncharacterized protein n=1 Tax=Enhygromyxa salina TaxID=215803 RepID=A0A2S9YEA5_9BACT|nr:hypothetical protein ENSA5_16290 [Enhygromyxa salina]
MIADPRVESIAFAELESTDDPQPSFILGRCCVEDLECACTVVNGADLEQGQRGSTGERGIDGVVLERGHEQLVDDRSASDGETVELGDQPGLGAAKFVEGVVGSFETVGPDLEQEVGLLEVPFDGVPEEPHVWRR